MASAQSVRFDIESIPLGAKRSLRLSEPVRWQVLVARGKQRGKTILVLGGVHGDEYEGPIAIHQLFRELRPAEMRGVLVAVPICNPLAFSAQQRSTPQDGKNLARCFPGKARGSVTERMAFALHHQFIAKSNFVIDLHSSGSQWVMPTLSGYTHGNPRLDRAQHAACKRFGAPIIWASTETPGRT